jgi:hypothetical protein
MTEQGNTLGGTFIDGFVTLVVDESCDAAADYLTKDRNMEFSEKDRESVKNTLCTMIGTAAAMSLKMARDGELTPTEIGIIFIKSGVNINSFSEKQQALCYGSLIGMGISFYETASELKDTSRDIRAAAMFSRYFGPYAPEVFGVTGTAALAAHAPNLYSTSKSLVQNAVDAYSQCGPLVMDSVKERSVGPGPIGSPQQCSMPQPPAGKLH